MVIKGRMVGEKGGRCVPNNVSQKLKADVAAHPAVDPRVELDHDVLRSTLGKLFVAARCKKKDKQQRQKHKAET